MNARERVRAALNHREPDRIPFDLGGTVVSSIHIDAYKRLREHLGLPTEDEPAILEMAQQIAVVDGDVLDRLGIDTAPVLPKASSGYELDIGQMDGYTYYYDEWGIGNKKPVAGGFYYDFFDHPLAGAQSIADVDDHPWPDPQDPARFEGMGERARRIAEEDKRAVVAGGLCPGIMEMAAWMRGYERFYIDTIENPDILGRIADIVLEAKIAYWEKALQEVGAYADVVMEGDDLGAQHGPLISPKSYRQVFKPRHKELFSFLRARTEAKIFLHTCGAVRELLPDLIEMGVDILNPVQVSAAGMETAALKRDFGQDMVFWGGGVDTQYVFTDRARPEQVREEVRRRVGDLAPGGGFVFAVVHNVQANVPPESVMAMWETLREYGAYG
jgi:uroporphyrinogen decarboxylase